jgi:hypothetical protein
MKKKKTAQDKDQNWLITLKDFDGMLNGKKFKFEANQSIIVNDNEYQWLKNKGVIE